MTTRTEPRLWGRGMVRYLRLLSPGLHIKRWLGLGALGVALIVWGLLYILGEILNVPLPSPLPVLVTSAGLVAMGAVLGLFSAWRLVATLSPAVLQSTDGYSVADAIYRYRTRVRGPRIVAIGGGTGLGSLLRGLKERTANITAIVTVGDDGGSSGRLRRELGVLPPGDIRNCLVALAESEPLLTRLFEYRFEEGSGLQGHSFGNLFIVAMSDVAGSFQKAVNESSRVLAVRGRVLPSTLTPVTLSARMEDGTMVYGEATITGADKSIRQLFVDPTDAVAYPEAVEAIHQADLIVLGPGSLYTSILPNLLVRGVRQAIKEAPGRKVYVCNVATQPGETDGYSAGDHVRSLYRYGGRDIVDTVVVNDDVDAVLPDEWPNKVVAPTGLPVEGVSTIFASVVNRDYRLRHDPAKLADVLFQVYHRG